MSKTRIFFDVSALPDVGKAVTGISRVVLSLVKHMANEHPDVIIQGISFRDADAPYRLWNLADIVHQANGLLDISTTKSEDQGDLRESDCVLLLGEQWLFPGTLPTLAKLKKERQIKVVSMVHDLVPFFQPELYWDGFPASYVACIDHLVELSDGFVVYSDNTQKDLLNQFPFLEDGRRLITRIRLGDSFHLAEHAPQQPPLPEGVGVSEFILCVGTIQPRKNHLLLLAVWRQLSEFHGESCPPLLLVGKQGWHVGDLMYFLRHSPGLQKKVHVLEQVSDEELQWLYQNCLFSVYPSLYEGWGLPIAESLSAHRFCLSSNTSSMPEVGGDLVDYFSPHDSGELYRLINQYLSDPALLLRKEATIRERFTPTSWSATTTQFVAAIKCVQSKTGVSTS